ncbi:class I SAM-dependent methyltransferase [Novipirellula artificiosorum]|uniref:Bifunctional 3-demethylubiquinone-9 3-methyltransferase/ 2-octaprenyl-6-hydroxy phenol methylase n=1 Tax=Novipirellula artificiosorum TaxID=2528016 RepID=A0A5C6DZZ9_9BACT|nr:methyltransferase domain-containing protein [Novipirellula artificiosorum]TWU40469.1 bifunctional 3-demethylubiquinone-9 3-methyltransferase/ 2-octaprenyl-6-hydroxy phenol methylase [Novipirellula artificiosorum]
MNEESFVEHAAFEKKHWWFLARQEIVVQLVSVLMDSRAADPPHPFSVLEIGCGTGATINRLSSQFVSASKTVQCTGADISADAIRIAKQDYPDRSFIVYKETADLADQIRAADCVLLLDVIEHVQDDVRMVAAIAEQMRLGATLVITVPADPSLWSSHDEALFHYRRYTAPRLTCIWGNLPICPLMTSGMNWRLAPAIRIARRFGRWVAPQASEVAKSDLSMPPSWINGLLRQVFASEAACLTRALSTGLQGAPAPETVPHPHGVSLVAVLRRTAGNIDLADLPKPPAIDDHVPRSLQRASNTTRDSEANDSEANKDGN